MERAVKGAGSGLQEPMAPFLDHCICCFLAKRRLMTRSTVASAKAVEMISPWSQRSAQSVIVAELFPM
ncbi:hypothetical protein N826_41190 [Skermanella aerolata KACC 11604]|nr:hypothetical protein N826_41190 [Skermanella aerolata KACC 11604]